MKVVRIILCTYLLSLSSSAYAKNYGTYLCSYVSNYDADTITCNIGDLPALIGSKITVRVLGIDAPEIRGKCLEEKNLAHKAKEFVEQILVNAKRIELRQVSRDKYFRILADVYADGASLAQLLIAKGYALPYSGGTRLPWCKYFDLAISDANLSTMIAQQGKIIQAQGEVKNEGTLPLNSTYFKYYLSSDTVLDASDQYLNYDRIKGTDPGEASDFFANLTIPKEVPSGVYYILLLVDATDLYDECNEQDNVVALPIVVGRLK